MEVILLQKVANLGNIGDKVKVKPGYGRNFLLPSGRAALATAANLKKFEERRSELEKLAADSLSGAQSRAKQLEGFKLTLQAKAGTEGKLFGSVGTSDIAEALTKAGIAIERAEVRLPGGPIRLIGEHHVKLRAFARSIRQRWSRKTAAAAQAPAAGSAGSPARSSVTKRRLCVCRRIRWRPSRPCWAACCSTTAPGTPSPTACAPRTSTGATTS
jgi:large subunit ribosomal protein L9